MNRPPLSHPPLRPQGVAAAPCRTRTPVAPTPDKGELRDLIRLMGGQAEPGDASAQEPITQWRVEQGAILLREGAPARTLFVLRTGSMKCVRTLEDGYEQVVSLVQPGDLLGFEALHLGRQPATLVALEDCIAFALSASDLPPLRRRCAALDEALQLALSRQLVRAAEAAEVMAAVSADVRLARFLLQLSARMREQGQSPSRLHLRLCRRDIASLLGVAHETVSRSFTTMAAAGLLCVNNRKVEILDVDGLKACARSTRWPTDDARPGVRRCGAQPLPGVELMPAWLVARGAGA